MAPLASITLSSGRLTTLVRSASHATREIRAPSTTIVARSARTVSATGVTTIPSRITSAMSAARRWLGALPLGAGHRVSALHHATQALAILQHADVRKRVAVDDEQI